MAHRDIYIYICVGVGVGGPPRPREGMVSWGLGVGAPRTPQQLVPYHSWGGGPHNPNPRIVNERPEGGWAIINARPRRRGADHQRKPWEAGER